MVQVTEKSVPDWLAVWGQVRERMRRELGDPVFDAWIGPLSLESCEASELKIGASKPFVRNWVANHYVGRIEKAFLAEGFRPTSLSIVMTAQPAPMVGGGVVMSRGLMMMLTGRMLRGLCHGAFPPNRS